jgi:hypothetical protein
MDKTIKWSQPDKYHLVSDCKKYHVAKHAIPGDPRYIAFVIDPFGNATQISNGLDSADAAKMVCETHKHMQTQKSAKK